MVMAIRTTRVDLHFHQRGAFLIAEMHLNDEVFEAGRVRSQLVDDPETQEVWVKSMVRLVEADVQRLFGHDAEFQLVERS